MTRGRLLFPITILILWVLPWAASAGRGGAPCAIRHLMGESSLHPLQVTALTTRLESALSRKITSPKELHEAHREIRKIRKELVGELSDDALKREVQKAMDRRIAKTGYLPGGSPDWNIPRLDLLIEDYLSHPRRQSLLGNIVDNLAGNDFAAADYIPFVKTKEELVADGLSFFNSWKKEALDTELYRVLEKRVKAGKGGFQEFARKRPRLEFRADRIQSARTLEQLEQANEFSRNALMARRRTAQEHMAVSIYYYRKKAAVVRKVRPGEAQKFNELAIQMEAEFPSWKDTLKKISKTTHF